MPKSRKPSVVSSPVAGTSSGHKTRRSRSVCSPSPSITASRLTSMIDQHKDKNLDSFALSPLSSRHSVLTNKTDIEEPQCKSWWKNLNEHSIEIMKVLYADKPINVDKTDEDSVQLEVMSEEDKNYTLHFSESSDNESVKSIVLPQRNLFNQKDNILQKKFGQIVGARENLTKLHKSTTTQHEKTIIAGTRKLFKGTQGAQPVFPKELLITSPNIRSKSKQNVAEKSLMPVKNIFAGRPNKKRKNIFADFILAESEDEVSDIQPKIFGFRRQTELQNSNVISNDIHLHSPTSSVSNDTELDDWKHLPSSTMVDSQLDQTIIATPLKRARLSRPKDILCEINEPKEDDEMEKKHYNKGKVNQDHTNQEMIKTLDNITEVNNKSYESGSHCELEGQNKIRNSRESEVVDERIANKYNENKIPESEGKQKSQVDENTDLINIESRSGKENQEKLNIKQVLNKDQENKDSSNQNQELENRSNCKVIENNNKIQESVEINKSHAAASDDKTEVKEKLNIENESQKLDKEGNGKNEVEIEFLKHKDGHQANEKERYEGQKSKYMDISKEKQNEEHGSQSLEVNNSSNIKENDEHEKQNSEYIDENMEISNNEIDNSQYEVLESECAENTQENQSSESEESENCHNSQKNDNSQDESEENQNEESVKEMDALENRETDSQVTKDNKDEHHELEYRGECQNDNNVNHIDIHHTSYGDQPTQHEKESLVSIDKNSSQNRQKNKCESQELENRDKSLKEQNKDCESHELGDTGASPKDESEPQELEFEDDFQKNNNEDEHQETIHTDKNQDKPNKECGRQTLDNSNSSQKIETYENKCLELSNRDEHPENLCNENGSQHSEYGQTQTKTNEAHVSQELEENICQENQISDQDDDELERNESQDSENLDISQDNENNQVKSEESEDNTDEITAVDDADETAEVDDADEITGVEDADESDEELNIEESNNVNNSDTSEQNQEEMITDDESNDENNEVDSIQIEEQSSNGSKSVSNYENNAPEVILDAKFNQQESFVIENNNTSNRKTKSMYNELNLRPSMAPTRGSLGLADAATDSSAEGSGWDSHRTTRKTLRQTFGKDFTPRKSLRALVLEKSAKITNTLHSDTAKFPLANSTEYAPDSDGEDDVTDNVQSDHEESRRERMATLENYLQKIKQQNLLKNQKLEESIRNSFKAPPAQDLLNLFRVPSKPAPRKVKPASTKPKKQLKSNMFFGELPSEVVEDMKYKPPKRFRPSNASWITKRLYNFLEKKLEPKYDYRARVRAEKLVETLYNFTKDLRRQNVASVDSVKVLKQEFARLDIVRTHFEFYEFFHEYMPREVRVKVVPDIVNKIPIPRHGVFTDIISDKTVQG